MKNELNPNNKEETKNEKSKSNKKSLITKISLAINCVFIAAILILVTSVTIFHVFDYAIVNQGLSLMCDSNFWKDRISHMDDTDRKRAIALFDYTCAQNGADTYYNDGFNKYLESLGLPKNQ